MSDVVEIERAVERLGPEELAEFRAWFDEFDADRWDRQFEADVAAGRLDALADEALAESRERRAASRAVARVSNP